MTYIMSYWQTTFISKFISVSVVFLIYLNTYIFHKCIIYVHICTIHKYLEDHSCLYVCAWVCPAVCLIFWGCLGMQEFPPVHHIHYKKPGPWSRTNRPRRRGGAPPTRQTSNARTSALDFAGCMLRATLCQHVINKYICLFDSLYIIELHKLKIGL